MPDEPKPPDLAVSPTGTPYIPPVVVKYLLPVVALAGGIALAQTQGIDISFLPPIVPKVCALVAFLGALVLGAGPGARK